MTDEGRIIVAVLASLSITALLAVIGIKYVRTVTRALAQSSTPRDAEAQ
jgi:hypothetical protein